MGRLELYYNTIIHLNGKQVLYQCLYRLRGVVRKLLGTKHNFSLYTPSEVLQLSAYIPKYESCKDDDFTFLNRTKKFDGSWEHKALGALWSYNMNYMEYLLQPSMDFDDGLKWIMSFIETQQRNVIGMSPYCVSLRSVNWIKFVTKYRQSLKVDDIKTIDTSLYSQLCILRNTLEYHLAGNHLMDNYFSLLWGAYYFRNEQWYSFASKNLLAELREQTLADGANYEQSPMYHCVILDRLLDAVNLLQNNPLFCTEPPLLNVMKEKASAMLGWLQCICYSDGTFPLFNDSAEGVAPTSGALFDYASRLGIKWEKGAPSVSGYRCVDKGKYQLRMDVGGIAASYIPGHSHADTFNFELRVADRPFVVDSGVSTYEWCSRRQYERSTIAHNTVTVDATDSSRVWGAFRCAQRAKVFNVVENETSVTASHNGYSAKGITHTRAFDWADDCIVVNDKLSRDAVGEAWLHFAPGLNVLVNGNIVTTDVANIVFENVQQLRLIDGECATEYNNLKKCKVLCATFSNEMRFAIRAVV